MLSYKKIGITMKSKLEKKEETLSQVMRVLREMDADIFVDAKHMADIESVSSFPTMEGNEVDLLLVIGGDGTILRSVRELQDFSVPVLGINRGAVGFLAEINSDEIDALLPSLLSGKGILEERSVLHAAVRRGDSEIFGACALNDAVISQGTISRLLDLKASIGGELLSSYHADGLIIATPTGSTAYSIAAGGPVVHPGISALLITPINPHSLNQRPIVVPGKECIEVQVMGKETIHMNVAVGLTIDGQVYQELQPGDAVTVKVFEKGVRFLRRKEDAFYQTLRTKLHWGE